MSLYFTGQAGPRLMPSGFLSMLGSAGSYGREVSSLKVIVLYSEDSRTQKNGRALVDNSFIRNLVVLQTPMSEARGTPGLPIFLLFSFYLSHMPCVTKSVCQKSLASVAFLMFPTFCSSPESAPSVWPPYTAPRHTQSSTPPLPLP